MEPTILCSEGKLCSSRALKNHKWAEEPHSSVKEYLNESIRVTEEANSKGVIFQNFPSTPDEAREIEELTDGFNLAIEFDSTEEPSGPSKYYNDRVALAYFRVSSLDSRSRKMRPKKRPSRDSMRNTDAKLSSNSSLT